MMYGMLLLPLPIHQTYITDGDLIYIQWKFLEEIAAGRLKYLNMLF